MPERARLSRASHSLTSRLAMPDSVQSTVVRAVQPLRYRPESLEPVQLRLSRCSMEGRLRVPWSSRPSRLKLRTW